MTDNVSDPTEPEPAAAGDPHAADPIGWGRALISGGLIVVVGFVACVWVPNLIVTRMTGWSAEAVADLAGVVAVGAVVLLSVVLRRLQARHLI